MAGERLPHMAGAALSAPSFIWQVRVTGSDGRVLVIEAADAADATAWLAAVRHRPPPAARRHCRRRRRRRRHRHLPIEPFS